MIRFFGDPLLTVPKDISTSLVYPGRVSCKYCAAWSKTPWFLAKNLPQHLKCASHIKSASEEQARRETQEHHDRLRAEDHERLRQPTYQYALLSHPNQPKVPLPEMPLPDTNEQQMWDDFDFDRLGEPLQCPNLGGQVNPIEREEAEFYRALDRDGADLSSSGKGFDEWDIVQDVDETLTNVMEDLG